MKFVRRQFGRRTGFVGNRVLKDCMGKSPSRSAAALLVLALALTAAAAQEAVQSVPQAPQPPHIADPAARLCLNQKERRALIEKGTVLHLAAALWAVHARASGCAIAVRASPMC